MLNKNYAEVPLEDILEWFHTNYEDAANGVFYNGREGGYQYLPGAGPCDPLDVLQAEFPDATSEILQKAANTLVSEASAWVKKGVY